MQGENLWQENLWEPMGSGENLWQENLWEPMGSDVLGGTYGVFLPPFHIIENSAAESVRSETTRPPLAGHSKYGTKSTVSVSSNSR